MRVKKDQFGYMQDGTAVSIWTLTSDCGMRLSVLDLGVTIQSLIVPDGSGHPVDVVLGYDTLEDYCKEQECFGATIGRFANRIAGASFSLDGKTYTLANNDGVNHIHGGHKGFDRYLWDAEELTDGILFSRISPDGEEGYPGTVQVSVKITLNGTMVVLHYRAISDRNTVINLTNHSYFNLDGGGDISAQELQIQADKYTLFGTDLIPTGEITSVKGTAVDFRSMKAIGKDLARQEACCLFGAGYDTNLILNGTKPAACARSLKTGIVMTVHTDQPGIQLYTPGAFPDMHFKKAGHFGPHPAFCLETQHYPDSVHHAEWPSCILKAGAVFESETCYAFSTMPTKESKAPRNE